MSRALPSFARTALAVVMVHLAIPAAPALACGTWTLKDTRGGRKALFFVNAVLEGRDGHRRRVLAVHGERPDDLQARTTHGTSLRFAGTRLVHAGRTVGRLEDGNLRMGASRYRIAVTPREAPPARLTWSVRVRRGGREVARGHALSFCACHRCDPEERRQDVERRVALYLAWRALDLAL